MTAPQIDSPPPEPPRRRSAGTWIVLLIVWTLGFASFLAWATLLVVALIRFLT